MEKSAAWYEGAEAFAQDLTDLDCPYEIGSDEAMDWMDGYMSQEDFDPMG